MTAVTNAATAIQGGIKSKNSVVKFDRHTGTTAYSAGDVISDDEAAAKALQFRGVGKSGRVDHVLVVCEETDTNGLELWLFDSEPTNHLDNAALALVEADAEKVIGVITLPNGDKDSGGGFQVYTAQLTTEGTNPHRYVADDGTLWGLLVTRTGYTPVASNYYSITIQIQAD